MKLRRAIVCGLLGGGGLVLGLTIAHWQPGRRAPLLQAHRVSAGLTSDVVSPGDSQDGAEQRAQPLVVALESNPLPASFLAYLAAALGSLQKDADSSSQDQILEELVDKLTSTNPAVALEYLKNQNAFGPGRDLSIRLARGWAGQDAKSAADWVTENLAGTVREEAINGVAIVWANQDLAGATAWATQLAEDDRESGLLSVAYEAARTHPMAALSLAADLSAGPPRDDLVIHAAMQWALQDATGAADWAKQITEQGLRDKVLAAVAAQWGEADPGAAATLATKWVAPGKPQDDAVVGIVERWVQKQPTDAAAWVTAFPDGLLRDTAMENVVKLWADQDVEKAGTWLRSLLAGPARDAAVGAYVSQVAPRSPELAASWTTEIGDDALRLREMEAVGESWMESDAAAARIWITQAPLPESTRIRLLALRSE